MARTEPSGDTASCSDDRPDVGGFFSLRSRSGRLTFDIEHTDQPLLATRCAGPLDVDVADALVRRTVSVARLRRGRLRIDLAADRPFAARGFAGTVDSSIVLTVGKPSRPAPHPSPAPAHPPRQRVLTLRDRVVRVTGQAVAAVHAAPTAARCGPLDACGLAGTITFRLRTAGGGPLELTAIAPRRRPARDLRTALGLARGGDPTHVQIFGAGELRSHGQVTAALSQQGGACRDHVHVAQTAIDIRRRGDRLRVELMPADSQAADPLRTRCPGPDLTGHPFAAATTPLSILRHRRVTVALRGVGFTNGPYRVRIRSTLAVTLARRPASARMRIEPFAAGHLRRP